MKSGVLWLMLAAVVAVSSSSRFDNDKRRPDCPLACSCSYDYGPPSATCTGFDSSYKFRGSLGKLTIENVAGLSLDDNIFKTVGLGAIQEITIRSSTFQKIGPKAFADLDQLKNLELEANNRMVLHPDIFNTTGLWHLSIRQSKLSFSENRDYLFDIGSLTDLELINADAAPYLNNESFSRMPVLEYINLASNMIKRIDPMFDELDSLESIDLSDNLITELSPNLFANTIVEKLDIHKNPLTSIRGLVVPELTELDVSLCKFSRIYSDMFTGTPKLARLNVSGNAISAIDELAFSNLEDLCFLDLSNNALVAPLPSSLFESNKYLETVSFSHNPSLKELPKNLFSGARDLTKVYLSYCGLTELQEGQFEGVNSPRVVILVGNYLEGLKPNALRSEITQLDLSHNNIVDLNKVHFPKNSRIERLSLANNRLREVNAENFASLHYLQQLDLESCGLRTLWNDKDIRKMFNVLKSLLILRLAGNKIEDLTPEQLDVTRNLKMIDIGENNMVCNVNFLLSMRWLKDRDVEMWNEAERSGGRDVRPGHPYGSDGLRSAKIDTIEAERIAIPHRSVWESIELQICGDDRRERLETTEEDGDEGDLDERVIDEDSDVIPETYEGSRINIGPVTYEERFGGDLNGYLWPITIVSVLAAILVSLSVLLCFILRWYRQRNSYGATILKHQLNTPRMKRDRSSIYQQLHEEINSPTTPVMSIKLGNGGKPGYITCASDENQFSKITPQSV